MKMVCATCGSDNVRRDADATWNVELQQWELCAVYDNATCEKCGGETVIAEIPKTQQEAPNADT